MQHNQIVEALKQASRDSFGPNLAVKPIEDVYLPNPKAVATSKALIAQLQFELQNTISTHELEVEKLNSNFKNQLNKANDEIDELKLGLKHLQNEKLQLQHDMLRQNNDFQMRCYDLLDKQVTKLSEQKSAELESINRRNEILIQQMSEAHISEVRCLKDRIADLERQIKFANQNFYRLH